MKVIKHAKSDTLGLVNKLRTIPMVTYDLLYGKKRINDHGYKKMIGNQTPRYRFNINLGLNWKGFDVRKLYLKV